MLKLARELDMVSIGLAFDEEDSLRVVGEAQPDIFCFHAGTTKGGLKGYDSGETIEQTAERTEAVNRKLRALKQDLILVAHGAAMETPEDAQFMLDHTSCDGFWTGSSTERLPIERAVSARRGEVRGAALRVGPARPRNRRVAGPMPEEGRFAVLATLDTKGQEAEFLREQLKALGSRALVVDMGVLGTPAARADVTRAEVARAGGRPSRRSGATRRARRRSP